jgi:hypothetical protein
VNPRLAALSARRGALQAEIALQRDDMAETYGQIERSTGRVDHALHVVRRMSPLIAVVGAVGLFALGPSRALSLLRRGLTLGVFVTQARRLLG